MTSPSTSPSDAWAIIALHGALSALSPDGEILTLSAAKFHEQAGRGPFLLIHTHATARRAHLRALPRDSVFDLLELFAFVHPARLVAPTPLGLAVALGLKPEENAFPGPELLPRLMALLLNDLRQASKGADAPRLHAAAQHLGHYGWTWSSIVQETLGEQPHLNDPGALPPDPLRIWQYLPKWEEEAPLPPPGSLPVTAAESRARLHEMLGPDAEMRAGQADFADVAATAFAPREQYGAPRAVLAEAGTGTGKTMGYLAPASLWAERNKGAVWVSTYTRHLQRQIESETRRLCPDETERRHRVVLRKGRENYLCLLNYEDMVNSAPTRPPEITIALILLARWAMTTREGDLFGGDLPGWFGEIAGHNLLPAVADRRGECIHGACRHYQTCYIEHSIRRARQADLVIANHALVMAQAAWSASGKDDAGNTDVPEEDTMPTRYVFDEGHHIADAADGAFAAEFSGLESAELRRWLLGAEGRQSRARGLRRRLDDLISGFPRLETPLDAALVATRALPAPGWSSRLNVAPQGQEPDLGDNSAEAPAAPSEARAMQDLLTLNAVETEDANPSEIFLRLLRSQVLARAKSRPSTSPDSPSGLSAAGLECDLSPPAEGLEDAAQTLKRALSRIVEPLKTLVHRLGERMSEDADALDTTARTRIEAMIRAIRRRAISRIESWMIMLDEIRPEKNDETTGLVPTHIHFIRCTRYPGQPPGEHDVGLHRHWLDPTIPFATVVAAPAHGLLITSATLRDETTTLDSDQAERAWSMAEARTGMSHLPLPAIRAALSSPFDYAHQTQTFIINDVPYDDIDAVAAAYRVLFEASGGGGLGLFTAIARLRAVFKRIAAPLESHGIPLYAQHIDAMDNTSLVDVFRTETNSCLLGTDAMRDGVDVPGKALRLAVFERVPWPRPDILHRERRLHLSGGMPRDYDDRIARLRLRQAFGRLIRARDDRGVFVLLDRRMPGRLMEAFPPGVTPIRTGIADAALRTRAFLNNEDNS
ncbi:MAG: ATP-dependent DNA helicase [Acetobacter sp.]|jgi:ATP-dependent DNA helicase DinG|nr:ATP-dependent DNA helicase [Acetobacter sp.]MCH4060411.1 ATP-dependent DNA helicase [Acetobacter sp.]MCH4087351.1 ATP-dependent DNA helicase [Acetobacter sp.]MCI1293870.1 ATP-dependent DNA helicase [Acetobacter sp.]MCI1320536.1 ATP-dependent DNA helicase [Acetobacter sp.]